MVFDGRYIANEPTFKRHAYTALKSRFPGEAAFEDFYASLDTPELKDEFLHAATFYLFLAKQGEWHLAVEGSAPVVDYLSTSFKIVAIFALIESLSDEHHQDFYNWLVSSRDHDSTFPIGDPTALAKLYEGYKESYGSIRRCVAFFNRLPPKRQQALCNSIKVNKKPLASIKKVAEFLYNLRSKFIHEARFVLSLVGHTALSMDGEKVVEVALSVETLLDTFEEGLLAYFAERRTSNASKRLTK